MIVSKVWVEMGGLLNPARLIRCCMKIVRRITLLLILNSLAVCVPAAPAVTNRFFVGSPAATLIVSNINAVTLQSGDYRFTFSADGYWSAGGGKPTGRFFTVSWPNGVQAQAITAGPSLGVGANITVQRTDGKLFDLQAFTGKILMNTAGAGGAFEVMPQLNGNDAFNDPLQYDCTGYAGASFSYASALAGYEAYQIHLWGDFALTALTLVDTNPPVLPAPQFIIAASAAPAEAGSAGGSGSYLSNSVCTLSASSNPGWGFQKWTENGAQVSASPNYSFTVRSQRTLVAHFVPAYTVTTGVLPDYGGSASGSGNFNSNSVVTVSATPNTGFKFVGWTEFGAPVSPSANYSFTLTADRSLTANFTTAGVSATFDFDTGTPAVGPGQGLPATQTKNGVTANFRTLAGGWSIQNNFAFWAPRVFSGNFLYPSTWGSAMSVDFSQAITNFTLAFLTGEVSSEYDTAGLIRATAYADAGMANPVATGSARGAWVSGAYPEGVLSFGSAIPFTTVKIEVPPQNPVPSSLFFADNIVVQLATPLAPHAPPLAFGGAFFQLAGQPLVINIADLMWSDYDPDGEPVFFVGVNPTTFNGLALHADGAQILVPANSVADGFSYTIADDRGVSTNGTATISIIANPAGRVDTLDLGVAGEVTARYTGVPWYSYECQRATNVTFTGTVQTWTAQAWADGSISVRDDFSDLPGQPSRAFYRMLWVP